MDRHDPLSQFAPAPAEVPAPPTPAKPKRSHKQPPLLRALADVSDESLAFLYGGPDQKPGDYERNKERIGEIRHDFAAFCEANPHFANWRQAWSAFMAQCPNEPTVFHQPATISQQPSLQTPAAAVPFWRQRLRAVCAANQHG